jgi:hypothetical protein
VEDIEMKEIKFTPLTNKERELIENWDKVTPTKSFGLLRAKKYVGKNVNLLFLNEIKADEGKKYIGSLQAVKGEDAWYLDAIDGERYRIPEPEEGIDELFDIEFKRTKIEETTATTIKGFYPEILERGKI